MNRGRDRPQNPPPPPRPPRPAAIASATRSNGARSAWLSGLLRATRRRFDPSSSPSASRFRVAVLPGPQRAQNPADFDDLFVRENLARGGSCSRYWLENAFFSATFVPTPGVQFTIFRKATRVRADAFRIHLPQSRAGSCRFDPCRPSRPFMRLEGSIATAARSDAVTLANIPAI
jgi:hypothetical protein